MITTNLSTLKINKLTQAQYEREFEAGNISTSELYLTEIDILPITDGGTGADNAATARTNLEVYSKAETDAAITNAIGAAIAASY